MSELSRDTHTAIFSCPSDRPFLSIIMADTVEARFKKAVWLIRNGPKEGGSSNDTKLQFYSFFKQVREEREIGRRSMRQGERAGAPSPIPRL